VLCTELREKSHC